MSKFIYRKFTRLFLLSVVINLSINAFIWSFFTKRLLVKNDNYSAGDLARLGYVSEVVCNKRNYFDLPKRHIPNYKYSNQAIDVVVVGDSFADGCGGLNPFFQDYIASAHNFNVLNIPRYKELSSFETAIMLVNSGYLNKVKPKYFILECVERRVIDMIGKDIDFYRDASYPEVETYFKEKFEARLPEVMFINTGNYNFLLFRLLYNFSDNALFSKTVIKHLGRPYFTGPHGDRLLFYIEDLAKINLSNEVSLIKVNDNLNKLAKILREKGIKFYFMPAPDKYNIYSEFISRNNLPRSTFFEHLRNFYKEYYFIDTKEMLVKAIKEGEKDIYHIDDTHWTWKAPKINFDNFTFEN